METASSHQVQTTLTFVAYGSFVVLLSCLFLPLQEHEKKTFCFVSHYLAFLYHLLHTASLLPVLQM